MSFDAQRPRRFIGGLILLVMAGAPLTVISVEALGIAWPLALSTFVAYLLIQALLMSWLVGILFQQHEMRKFRIGIGAMLLLTTMIALPMGAASIYRHQSVPEPEIVAEQNIVPSAGTTNTDKLVVIIPIFTAILYFSTLPLLMVCEAVLHWYLAYHKRRSSRTSVA